MRRASSTARTFNKEECETVNKALFIIDSTSPEINKPLLELIATHTRQAGADCRTIVKQLQLEFGLEWQYVDPSGKLKTLAGRHDKSVVKFLEEVYRGIRLPYLNEHVDDRPLVLVSVGNWLRKAAKLAAKVARDCPERTESFIHALRYSFNRTVGITPALYVLYEPKSLGLWLHRGLALFPHEDSALGRVSIMLNGNLSANTVQLTRAINEAFTWNW